MTWRKSLEVLAAVGLGDATAGDPGQDAERRRGFIPAGQGGLARQAAFKGRSRPRDCRTAAQRQVRHRLLPFPPRTNCRRPTIPLPASYPPTAYKLGDSVATREAFGNALVAHRRSRPAHRGDGWRHEELHLFREVLQEVPGPLHGMLHRGTEHGGSGHGLCRARQSAVRLHVRRPSSRALTTRSAWPAFRMRTSSWSGRTSA